MANNKFTQIEMPDGSIYDISGGTEVVANPDTDATDSLTKITIGDITYDISGGGGSSSSGISIKTLWEGIHEGTDNIQLSDSVLNYDFIIIELNSYYSSSDAERVNNKYEIIPKNKITINEGNHVTYKYLVNIFFNTTYYCSFRFGFDTETSMIFADTNGSWTSAAITGIYGIKFNSTSGGGSSSIEIGTFITNPSDYDSNSCMICSGGAENTTISLTDNLEYAQWLVDTFGKSTYYGGDGETVGIPNADYLVPKYSEMDSNFILADTSILNNPHHAFDRTIGDGNYTVDQINWSQNPRDVVIGYDFKVPTPVNKYSIACAIWDGNDTNRQPTDWTIEGRNSNDEEWTVIDTQSGITSWSRGETKSFTLDKTYNYKQYRLNSYSSTSAYGAGLSELTFSYDGFLAIKVKSSKSQDIKSSFAGIDTDRVVAEITSSVAGTEWTATEDCWIIGNLVAENDKDAYVYIDDKPVQYAYSRSNTIAHLTCVPVKKGQVVKITACSDDYIKIFKAYGVLSIGGGGSSPTSLAAEQVSYDNTVAGLAASNVQSAIDELKTNIPFSLAIDEQTGAYGYIKKVEGADTFVPFSFGGGGGTKIMEQTVLWEDANHTTPLNENSVISFSDNLSNYDLIYLKYAGNTGFNNTLIIDPKTIITNNYFILTIRYGNYHFISVACIINDNNITATSDVVTHGLYTIMYIENVIGIKFVSPNHTYSTEEQVVGTWIDGKPLYQKTLELTTPGSSSSEIFDLTNLNVDLIQSIDGMLYEGGVYEGQYKFKIPFYNSGSVFANIYIDNKKLIWVSSSYYLNQPILVTIQYTKTTD